MDPYYGEYLALLRVQLNELKTIVSEVPADGLDWTPGPGVNSLAVLAAHTAGATRMLAGDAMSGNPSSRDRDGEFQTQAFTADSLCALLDDAGAAVERALAPLTLQDLHGTRFVARQGRERTTVWLLLHALEHAAQHVGHAQLTRQLFDQRSS